MAVCLIEARRRKDDAPAFKGARFGFTVTKKLGNAVTRNRIRRRLKSAVSALSPTCAADGFDYVVVARAAALDRPYADMLADLTRAFSQLHKSPRSGREGLDKPRQQVKKPPNRDPV